jgi:2OG-Fe(II) oxygenase superfamily
MIERSQTILERGALSESLLRADLWQASAELSNIYHQKKAPIPHIQIAQFLDPGVALSAANEFPIPDTRFWIHYKHYNEDKVGLTKKDIFPPVLRRVADELNSRRFVSWLSELTGIRGLVADPELHGGGLHQCGRGGFLNLHTDFSTHYYNKNWRRRVNVILYLNPGWKPEWGGALEFWDRKLQARVAKYAPLLNHAVIFNTDNNALHGFPDPLQCPENVRRKSIAFYYYTPEENLRATARPTDYQARPGDSVKKRAFIWLDKTAVGLYSRTKAKLGFSDDLVSRILRASSRKK